MIERLVLILGHQGIEKVLLIAIARPKYSKLKIWKFNVSEEKLNLSSWPFLSLLENKNKQQP